MLTREIQLGTLNDPAALNPRWLRIRAIQPLYFKDCELLRRARLSPLDIGK